MQWIIRMLIPKRIGRLLVTRRAGTAGLRADVQGEKGLSPSWAQEPLLAPGGSPG